jgi:S1/P1 Nuclease
MLAADPDGLTAHTIAAETTWADKFRDSDRNTTKVHYNQTHNWHFIDIELIAAHADAACFGHPVLPPGTAASVGPANDCVVDKIEHFTAELAAPGTSPEERLVALKFLLHFVGDLHQPLHASDDHEAGGNQKNVTAVGFAAGNLHHYWDTTFVQNLGAEPFSVADKLRAKITKAQLKQWSKGKPADWALESFQTAKEHAYGKLPAPNAHGTYELNASYVANATETVDTQLSKAGIRLARILNDLLGH